MNTLEKNEANIRYLLYKHPLYETVSQKCDQPWRIVIAGFSQSAICFIRQALCLAVINAAGADFRILMTESQRKDAERFLAACPALGTFFKLNGSPASIRHAYGRIDFIYGARLSALLTNTLKERAADYIYLSAGTEQATLNLAVQCSGQSPEALIAADCQQKTDSRLKGCPHLVIAPSSQDPDPECRAYLRQIEQIARNLHWIWADPNAPYAKTERDFMREDNHSSSTASACSVQYKLYCIFHADMRALSAGAAADLFSSKITDEETGVLNLDKISWAEHRRWCAEKILLGYQQWNDYKQAAELRTTHIETPQKLHLCLRERLSDTEIELLGGKKLHDFQPEAWDSLNPDAFPDEIDKMSLQYHAAFQRLLKDAVGTDKNDFPFLYQDIYRQIADKPRAVIAYHNWRMCIRRILRNGDPNAIILYADAKHELAPYVTEGLLNRIDDNVKSAMKAFKRTDYHYIDTMFTENIPHILTYSHDITLFIPISSASCDITDPTAVFHNISAVFALDPAEAHCLIHLQSKQEWEEQVLPFLRRINQFFNYKEYRTSISVHLFCPSGMIRKSALKDELNRLLLRTHCANTFPEAVCAAKKLLKRQKNYAVQYRKNCALSGALAADPESIPHFIFDSASQIFSAMHTEHTPEDVRMFDYIRKKALRPLLISDIGVLSGAKTKPAVQPRYELYTEDLIRYYQHHITLWKTCCNLLSENCERKIEFPRFGVPRLSFSERVSRSKKINLIGIEGVFQTMQQQFGMIRDYKRYTDESGCYIFDMEIPEPQKNKFQEIFNNIRNFDGGTAEYSFVSGVRCLEFIMNTLTDRFPLRYSSDAGKGSREAEPNSITKTGYTDFERFINKMKDFGFVRAFRSEPILEDGTETGRDIVITYTDRESKSLLTASGRLLEIFLYTGLLRYFTDMQTSVEIIWDIDRNLRNELDVIGVCGYQTVILEAKARTRLEADIVYKIRSIAKNYGINPKAIVVEQTDKPSKNMERIGNVYHVHLLADNRLNILLQRILELMDFQA